jgi:hypothetical protein
MPMSERVTRRPSYVVTCPVAQVTADQTKRLPQMTARRL